jgi:transketolase C-terminal domain/subunit
MQGRRGDQRNFDFTARAEARIAYVKAKLKITQAQEAAFNHYAQVIRDHAAATQKAFEDMRARRGQNNGQTMNAIDRVEQRAKMAQLRDQQQQQYLAAFRPLYASLSDDQKKVADDLATPHFGHGHGHHHGGGPRRG